MNDRLSIVIPTAGRLSLERTLQSYRHQMQPEDELIVVFDTLDMSRETNMAMIRIAERYGAQYSWAQASEHTWGHQQVQAGMAQARGDFLVFNDDDDVATPDALASIRRTIQDLDEPKPLMFSWMTWMDIVLWDEPRLVECHVGGHALVPPNIPERLGQWSYRYNGDWDFIRSTIDLWPNKDADIVWRENLIAWARPTDEEWRELLQPRRKAVA